MDNGVSRPFAVLRVTKSYKLQAPPPSPPPPAAVEGKEKRCGGCVYPQLKLGVMKMQSLRDYETARMPSLQRPFAMLRVTNQLTVDNEKDPSLRSG